MPTTAAPDETRLSWSDVVSHRRGAMIEAGYRAWLVGLSIFLATIEAVELFSSTHRSIVPFRVDVVVQLGTIAAALSLALWRPSEARRLRVLGAVAGGLTVAAAVALSLGSLHEGYADDPIHLAMYVLMLGLSMLLPMTKSQGVPILALVAVSYPAMLLLFGLAHVRELDFALKVADLAAGFAAATMVLVVHNSLFARRSEALRQLARLAEHDALTGVYNRRTFMARLTSEANRSSRYGRPFGVVFYDIDEFKRFNSDWGYATGDAMLQAVGGAIDALVSSEPFASLGGIVARYGGEEFVVLLPDARSETVERFALASIAAVEALEVPHKDGTLQVTVSAGFTTAPGGVDVSVGRMLEAADRALYVAKQRGGNTAVESTDPVDDLTPTDPRFIAPKRPTRSTQSAEFVASGILDRAALHAFVLRWILIVSAAWVLFLICLDVAVVVAELTPLPLPAMIFGRVVLASTTLLVVWRASKRPWWNDHLPEIHAVFIATMTGLVLWAMHFTGGLTSPYFNQLLFPIIGWALALTVSTPVSAILLGVIASSVPLFGLLTDELEGLNHSSLMRFAIVVSACVCAVATQSIFARLRAEEVSARGELDHLARIDPLTGLPNRTAFEQRAERLIARAGPSTPMMLLMLDLDHFKLLNDTYGHLVGDEALTNISAALEDTTRTADVVARIGGEEFVVLLPMTTLNGAKMSAQRIRERLKGVGVGPHQKRVTASIGISAWEPGDTVSAMLARADDALRQAKREGRDRVSVSDASDGAPTSATAPEPAGSE